MVKLWLVALFCIMSFTAVSCKKKSQKKLVMVGKPAPDFALLDETGTLRKLSDYRGQKVVLYFYPKDFTPGCTAQACSLRDDYAIYREHNIVILGISYDSVQSHKKFKAEHRVPYTLLSDTSHQVAKLYGVNKNFISYIFAMPSRITFLIDEHGVIVHVFNKIDIEKQSQDILKYLA